MVSAGFPTLINQKANIINDKNTRNRNWFNNNWCFLWLPVCYAAVQAQQLLWGLREWNVFLTGETKRLTSPRRSAPPRSCCIISLATTGHSQRGNELNIVLGLWLVGLFVLDSSSTLSSFSCSHLTVILLSDFFRLDPPTLLTTQVLSHLTMCCCALFSVWVHLFSFPFFFIHTGFFLIFNVLLKAFRAYRLADKDTLYQCL